MTAITTIFDNREVSLLLWMLVLVILGFITKTLRSSFLGVIKALFAPQLITILALMGAYAGLLVYLLSRGKIWTTDLAGETIFWFFGPAFVLFIKADEAGEDPHFFRHAFASVFTLTVVIGFLDNVFPLNLIAELLLVPIFVLLGGTLAIAASRAEYSQVKTPPKSHR